MKNSKNKIKGLGKQVPPDKIHVVIWFLEKGGNETAALAFFRFYRCRGWRNLRGALIKDWKVRAWDWLWNKTQR